MYLVYATTTVVRVCVGSGGGGGGRTSPVSVSCQGGHGRLKIFSMRATKLVV